MEIRRKRVTQIEKKVEKKEDKEEWKEKEINDGRKLKMKKV